MDEWFTQGWVASVIHDHWTAEEEEEHLIAARAVNDKQAVKFISAHKSLKEVQSTLDNQGRERAQAQKYSSIQFIRYASSHRSEL